MAARRQPRSFRARWSRHSQTDCRSDAFVRQQINWCRLGIWTERSARSGRRDDRTATYGAGTLSQRRISNRFCCAVHSSFALSCDFGHGAASSPPPARIGSGRWTHPCDSESDASLLDLSRCRRVACCRVCRFRIDRFPLSKDERHAGKFYSRVLCSCKKNGNNISRHDVRLLKVETDQCEIGKPGSKQRACSEIDPVGSRQIRSRKGVSSARFQFVRAGVKKPRHDQSRKTKQSWNEQHSKTGSISAVEIKYQRHK